MVGPAHGPLTGQRVHRINGVQTLLGQPAPRNQVSDLTLAATVACFVTPVHRQPPNHGFDPAGLGR